MKTIGVRELKIHASGIVQQVREAQASYVVTFRGHPVGVLSPVEAGTMPVTTKTDGGWEHLGKLADRIGKGWKSKKSSVEIVSEMRR